jgi:hypothetical protein
MSFSAPRLLFLIDYRRMKDGEIAVSKNMYTLMRSGPPMTDDFTWKAVVLIAFRARGWGSTPAWGSMEALEAHRWGY